MAASFDKFHDSLSATYGNDDDDDDDDGEDLLQLKGPLDFVKRKTGTGVTSVEKKYEALVQRRARMRDELDNTSRTEMIRLKRQNPKQWKLVTLREEDSWLNEETMKVNGEADEWLESDGPIDWLKRKTGTGTTSVQRRYDELVKRKEETSNPGELEEIAKELGDLRRKNPNQWAYLRK